jgi:hypothetical protein
MQLIGAVGERSPLLGSQLQNTLALRVFGLQRQLRTFSSFGAVFFGFSWHATLGCKGNWSLDAKPLELPTRMRLTDDLYSFG